MKGQRGRGDRYWDRKHEMLRKRRGMEIMRGGRKVGISKEWRRRRGQQRDKLSGAEEALGLGDCCAFILLCSRLLKHYLRKRL